MATRLAIGAAGCVAAVLFLNCTTLAQIDPPASPPPTSQPANDPDDIPVKQVVLFSSGVGYFEHAGTVHGDASTVLRFKTDQINDILKSLLVQDMDGGAVGAVSYPGLAPLAHTLKSFQVDLTANPDMADLLNQLRGARITVATDGKQEMTGVILGVEKQLRAVNDRTAVETLKLNLKVGHQFRSVSLYQIQSMELDDPALQKELDDALAAIAQARDQDKKPMTLRFNGKGERHVRIGYLVETPIWKTSYRLVLGASEMKKQHEAGGAAPPTTAPSDQAATRAGDAAPHAANTAKIQGWAIVENQTDNDWNDIQLSLVNGHPLSFIQDLYHSQYIPRPVVQGDSYVSLRPQTYTGSLYDTREAVAGGSDYNNAPDFSLTSGRSQNQNSQSLYSGPTSQPSAFFDSGGQGQANNQQPIDPTASIVAAATAARVGELFKYRIGNVSLAKQTSAMIPIVTDDIEAERISIYNANVLPTHPLLGARLRNNTGKYLLAGPLTVLDHGSYAGDARIEDTPPGQERLISFGVDQQMLIDASGTAQNTASVTAKIAKGVMTLTSRNVQEQTYLADNKSNDVRILVIEHARQAEFKLVAPPQADETTPDLFRFRRAIPPHKTLKLIVTQERVFDTSTEVLSASANLSAVVQDGAIPQKVRDALARAIGLRDQVTILANQGAELRGQMEELSSDQNRVRENLKAVAAESDYYKRLMKKIDAEEDDIEKLQRSIVETQQAHQATEAQLNEYVNGLTVE